MRFPSLLLPPLLDPWSLSDLVWPLEWHWEPQTPTPCTLHNDHCWPVDGSHLHPPTPIPCTCPHGQDQGWPRDDTDGDESIRIFSFTVIALTQHIETVVCISINLRQYQIITLVSSKSYRSKCKQLFVLIFFSFQVCCPCCCSRSSHLSESQWRDIFP